MKISEVIIHTGITKTGTTSIQSCLESQRKILEREGVLYPRSFLFGSQHLGLSMSCLSPEKEFQPRKIHNIQDKNSIKSYAEHESKKLKEEIKNTSPSRVIFSDEGLSGINLTSEVESLANLILPLNPDEIKIICYLRRQGSHIASNITQSITSGQHYQSLEYPHEGMDEDFYNYKKKIDLLSNEFGSKNIILKIYEDHTSTGGTAIDFIKTLSLPITPPSNEENTSPSKTSISILNEINKYEPFATLTPAQQFAAIRTLAGIIENHFGCKEKYQVPEEAIKEFNKKAEASNEELRIKYLPQRTELFPPKKVLNNHIPRKISPPELLKLMRYIVQAAHSAITLND